MKQVIKYEEFVKKFKAESAAASSNKQISMAIGICKRLYLYFKEFAADNNFGDPDLLLHAIEIAENFKSNDAQRVKQLLPLIEKNCPHADDFGNAIYAINASGAVYETLEFLIDHNPAHIYNLGTYLTDTVDFKIQEDSELTDDEIDNHPMMIEVRNYLIKSLK